MNIAGGTLGLYLAALQTYVGPGETPDTLDDGLRQAPAPLS